MNYAEGAELLSPIQQAPTGASQSPTHEEVGRDDVRECLRPNSDVGTESQLRSAIACLHDLGADVADAVFDKSPPPAERQALRGLLLEISRRKQAAEDGLAEFYRRTDGGPEASSLTHLMALLFGEKTVGMHLTSRARSEIRGANAMRLAAATGSYGAMKVFDRWALRGFASTAIDEIFADARGSAPRPDDASGAPSSAEQRSNSRSSEESRSTAGPATMTQADGEEGSKDQRTPDEWLEEFAKIFSSSITAAGYTHPPPWDGHKPARGANSETKSGRALGPQAMVERWWQFLGPGPYNNVHPRTGANDDERVVSADGQRSIRYGNHERSADTSHHYHEETWSWDPALNVLNCQNLVQRVPLRMPAPQNSGQNPVASGSTDGARQ